MKPFISGFYLAAGLSSRMEGKIEKLLLPLSRGNVMEYSLSNLLASSADEIIIVTGGNLRVEQTARRLAEKYRKTETGINNSGQDKKIILVRNEQPEMGMASSVKLCMERADSRAAGYLFMLADQPFVTAEGIDEAADMFRNHPGKNVIPFYKGERGHPVIISSRWKSMLMTGVGDFGGRKVIKEYPEETLWIDVAGTSSLPAMDIDSYADYKQALQSDLSDPLKQLLDLIQKRCPGCITLSGGGGKTSLMKYLGGLLAAGAGGSRRLSVVMTTTTKLMGPEHTDYGTEEVYFGPWGQQPDAFRADEADGISGQPALWLGNPAGMKTKYCGPGTDAIRTALARKRADVFLIEADGSAGRPVKVPGEHEPVIPPFADVCMTVMGMSALGKPADGTAVHRLEEYKKLFPEAPDVLTPEVFSLLSDHPACGFKNVPAGALKILVFNQCDVFHGNALKDLQEYAEKKMTVPDAIIFLHLEPYPSVLSVYSRGCIR